MNHRFLLVAIVVGTATGRAQAQTPAPVGISAEGVVRATASVDDVFVARATRAAAVGGADWVAYLMARLGVQPIPALPGFRVGVDTSTITLSSRLADLPAQTRTELGPMVGLLDPATPISATIVLMPAGPVAVRFHLQTVSINGFAVPEPFLQSYLGDIGRRYPMLTRTGRDLLVQIPEGGVVRLGADSIHLSLP